jgi:nucleotide-binding universal stress UspA family protein
MKTLNIKKILIPVDLYSSGEMMLDQAALLANETKAGIVMIAVLEGPALNAGEKYFDASTYDHAKFDDMQISSATKLLEKYKADLLEKGVAEAGYIIERGKPYKKILDAAITIKADIIIMGMPDLADTNEGVIGSNTFKVVSKALCPVLSTRNNFPKEGVKNILLPFRDKPHSRESVEYAIEVAEIYGAVIHVLGVSYDPSEEGIAKIQLEAEQIKHILDERNVKNTLEVIAGNYVAKLINAFAKKKEADLLVIMADMDKMSISEYVIGPVVQQLINHSKIPVLSIHPIINFNVAENEMEPINSVDWKFWN